MMLPAGLMDRWSGIRGCGGIGRGGRRATLYPFCGVNLNRSSAWDDLLCPVAGQDLRQRRSCQCRAYRRRGFQTEYSEWGRVFFMTAEKQLRRMFDLFCIIMRD